MKIAPKPKPGSTLSLDDLLREKPKAPIDALRGNPFVTDIQTYNDPEDGAFGDSVLRDCQHCFYRAYPQNKDGDCHIDGAKAKLAFGISPKQFMPTRLDDKEVGAYCPCFADYRVE